MNKGPDHAGESPDWRTWNSQQWAERLLQHYFGLAGDEGGPVTSLDVSDLELARATGDPAADPEAVRSRLIEMTTRAAASTGKDFWKHAQSRTGFSFPWYLAHLVVACTAVIDASDAEENSNIDRIAHVVEGLSGDNHLEVLPELWLALQAWLTNHSDHYRPLVIPDPGGWTRIGHTVRLAFPSRADRQKLADCLRDHDLEMDDPPLGPVLHAVGTNRQQFGARFLEEYERFRTGRAEGTTLHELHAMPFWSAVRSVTAVEAATTVDPRRINCTLIAEDDGYEVEILLVAEQPLGGVPSEELDNAYSEWTHVAVADADGRSPVERLLGGEYRPARLRHAVQSGLLPFFEAIHGALELGSRAQLSETQLCLVANPLVDQLRATFGNRGTRTSQSPFEGWVVVRGLQLHVVDDEVLDGSPLESCWMLRQSPIPRRIQLKDGIRVGSGWLGAAPLLPSISAPDATAVEIGPSGGDLLPLERRSDEWALHTDAMAGSYDLLAEFDDGVRHRTLEFVAVPDSEQFRPVGRPDSWVVESSGRSIRLTSEPFEYNGQLSELPAAVDRVLLTRDLGCFTSDAADAAWEITHHGQRTAVRQLAQPTDLMPRIKSEDRGDRRRWRRLLEQSDHSALDADSLAALHLAVRSEANLPTGAAAVVELSRPNPVAQPSPRLGTVVGAIVAICNRRSGLDRRQLSGLLIDLLGIDYPLARQVIRAWQENSMIAEVVNTRWSGRHLIPCEPSIVVFSDGHAIHGTLRGLTLDSTRSEIRQVATASGISTVEIGSVSEYVPPALGFRVRTLDAMESLAGRLGLGLRYLRCDPFQKLPSRDLQGPQPGGYRETGDVETMDGGVVLRRWSNQGSPSYWTIEGGSRVMWTHFFEAARFWGAQVAGQSVVEQAGPFRLRVVDAHLPLSVARWMNDLGGCESGPTRSGGYEYSSPSAEVTRQVGDGLGDFAMLEIREVDKQGDR